MLTVVDTFSRFSPVLDARFTYRAEDVVQTLDRATIGYPKTIRVDQGTEFVSRDLDIWAYVRGVTLDFSRPGKPTDNCVRRGIQQPRPSRMHERPLVPDACGYARKDGLAQILQRGTPARVNRA